MIVTDEPIAVSVVVPCYNEEQGIANTLGPLIAVLDKAGFSSEIILVDDASSDATAAELGLFRERATILTNAANLGYGGSLKRGIRAARAPLICIVDADGTYPSEAIPELVALATDRDCDMAVASRTGENVKVPAIRKPAKWALGLLASYVAGQRIPDMNSGLRIFPRETALRMFGVLPDVFPSRRRSHWR